MPVIRRLLVFVTMAAALGAAASLQAAAGAVGQVVDIETEDIFGNPLNNASFRDKVSVITFVVKATEQRANEAGQTIGERYGHRRGFQAIALVNTSDMGLLLRAMSGPFLRSSYEQSAARALSIQHKRGNTDATLDDVKRRIVFVNDKTGELWRRFGLDPTQSTFAMGILSPNQELIYLKTDPIALDEVYAVLDGVFEGRP